MITKPIPKNTKLTWSKSIQARAIKRILRIREYLIKSKFKVEYTKVYNEYLSPDFDRKSLNDKASELIEALAIK